MLKKYYLLLSTILLSCVFNNVYAETLSDVPDSMNKEPKITSEAPQNQRVDQGETLFSIKGAVKDVGHAVKDTAKKGVDLAKKGAEKGVDLAKKGAKTAKDVGKKGVDVAKKGAKEVKKGVQNAFKMTVSFAKKVPWTMVFQEGLKIAVPALKGCVKSGVMAAVPAVMAGVETLGLGTVGTLAGACAIGGAKSSIPAIIGVSVNVFNSWSNKQKADAIQQQIDLNQQDSNAVSSTIAQAKSAEKSLKSKEEVQAAEIAITNAQKTKKTIDTFVGQLKAEQKKYK